MMSRLYWVGLYEDSNRFKWFFQVDLTPAILPGIGYFAKCMVAGGKHILILLTVRRGYSRTYSFMGIVPLRPFITHHVVVPPGFTSLLLPGHTIPRLPVQLFFCLYLGSRPHWFLCGAFLVWSWSTCMYA